MGGGGGEKGCSSFTSSSQLLRVVFYKGIHTVVGAIIVQWDSLKMQAGTFTSTRERVISTVNKPHYAPLVRKCHLHNLLTLLRISPSDVIAIRSPSRSKTAHLNPSPDISSLAQYARQTRCLWR